MHPLVRSLTVLASLLTLGALADQPPRRVHGPYEAALTASLQPQRPVLSPRPQPLLLEAPDISRLALYVAPDASHPQGQFLPVTNGGIEGPGNVYFVAHGWAPGYSDWVECLEGKNILPLWWNTLRSDLPCADQLPEGTTGAHGGSTPWMYVQVTPPDTSFDVTPAGLAAQILKADKTARVILYSWIDESATAGTITGLLNASHSEAYTAQNGYRLAAAIRAALAPDFRARGGKLHLLGHSHGSKVVTVAAQALRMAAGNSLAEPFADQLTPLDSPENQSPDDDSFPPTSYDAANLLWFHLAQLFGASVKAPKPFVDSYISAFANSYSNFTVYDPDQGLNTISLSGIIDVNLDPIPYSDFSEEGISGQHSYAPAWYAGSATATGTKKNPDVGLLWSPLLSTKAAPFISQQSWNELNYSAKNQFYLESWKTPSPQWPLFEPITVELKRASDGATYSGRTNAITGVTLTDPSGDAMLVASFVKYNSQIVGFSFDYDFTAIAKGDQLQILIDGYLYFVMTGSVAAGVPGQNAGHSTLGLGYESSKDWIHSGVHQISFILVKASKTAQPSSVTITNFHTFTW